jgi:hypothetical protein
MSRPGPRILTRSALAALAALILVGWIHSTSPPAPLVAAGAEDLEKFAPLDMAQAVARAVTPEPIPIGRH